VLFNKAGTNLIQYACGKKETDYTIPSSVTSISSQAFDGCSNLASIAIHENVTKINLSSFKGIPSLKTIIVDGNNKFYKAVDNVLFNKEGTNLIQYACAREETNYSIPNSVTSISSRAFYGCSNLASIAIPVSVSSIDSFMFYGCGNLASIAIPDSVTSIGQYAFSGCSSLTSITIPDSVTSIDSNVFSGCSNLASITIPQNVTSIDVSAFYGCTLRIINVDGNNQYYKAVDNVLFNKEGTNLIQFACGKKETNYLIPDSITSIGKYAFRGCSNLKSITIPENVTSIETSAFSRCTSLTSITIPDSVTSIGSDAFYECNSLTSVIMSDSVTSIRSFTFNGCSNLASIAIPDSVTSIGYHAFFGCSKLASITFGNSVETIDDGALMNCSDLVILTIESNLSSVGLDAFSGCYNLTNVNYLGVTQPSFLDNVFNDCTNLSCVTVTPEYSWKTFCNVSTCDLSSLSSGSSSSSESLTFHSDSDGNYSIIDGLVVEVITEGVISDEMNMSQFRQAVSILTNVPETSMRIDSKVDDEGNIVAILVTVKDEETANIIADALNRFSKECQSMSQGDDELIACDGILRYVRSASVVSKTIELSYSCSPYLYQLASMMMFGMTSLLFNDLY